jgi:hypothetical protein
VRSRTKALVAIVVAAAAAVTVFAANEASSRVPKPVVVIERGEKCVEDTDFMRRDHHTLLKHQRIDTVHKGIREAGRTLQGCVDCHASRKTGSVIGSPDAFCESCHDYVGARLDCFECHSPKAKPAGKPSARPGAEMAAGGLQ